MSEEISVTVRVLPTDFKRDLKEAVSEPHVTEYASSQSRTAVSRRRSAQFRLNGERNLSALYWQLTHIVLREFSGLFRRLKKKNKKLKKIAPRATRLLLLEFGCSLSMECGCDLFAWWLKNSVDVLNRPCWFLILHRIHQLWSINATYL